jgi:hypothetical protein
MKFEVEPTIGIGPVKLGADRASVATAMKLKPQSFMKTPMSKHPTDAFYDTGFQVFYEGDEPQVESIELSRECGFEIALSGINVFALPAEEALSEIEKITGVKPQSEDDGYSYEMTNLDSLRPT